MHDIMVFKVLVSLVAASVPVVIAYAVWKDRKKRKDNKDD